MRVKNAVMGAKRRESSPRSSMEKIKIKTDNHIDMIVNLRRGRCRALESASELGGYEKVESMASDRVAKST